MTPIEVLKMLKSKIDAAGLYKCNYAIETSDIAAINKALLFHDVSGQFSLLNHILEICNEDYDGDEKINDILTACENFR